MKRLLTLLLCFVANVALAQSLPHPNYFRINTIDTVALGQWTANTIYDSSSLRLNGYNITGEFGANTVGMVQGLVGAITVPSSATVVGANAVAGYALTQSTTTNAIGIYGQGLINTSGVGNAWGGNTLVANCPLSTCLANTGQNGNVYGLEVDVNYAKNSGGGSPAGNVKGIYVNGQLAVAPASDFAAIEVDHVAAGGGIGWGNGLKFDTGCCNLGVVNEPAATGNSQNSIQNAYVSTNGSGGALEGTQFLDNAGNMQITPGAGGVVSLNNGSQVSKFTVGGTNNVSVSPLQPTFPGGIIGNTTGNLPSAGSVGQLLTNTTIGTSLTSGTVTNCSSLSLPAGDWEVSGTVYFNPAPTTTITLELAGIATTSATVGPIGTFQDLNSACFATGLGDYMATGGPVDVNLSSPATVYVVGQSSFGTSTMTCNGFIRARRID